LRFRSSRDETQLKKKLLATKERKNQKGIVHIRTGDSSRTQKTCIRLTGRGKLTVDGGTDERGLGGVKPRKGVEADEPGPELLGGKNEKRLNNKKRGGKGEREEVKKKKRTKGYHRRDFGVKFLK